MATYICFLVTLSAILFCFSDAVTSTDKIILCHGERDTIACSKQKRIEIISAMWGRKDKDLCGLGTKVCERDVKPYIDIICETQKSCNLVANTVDLPNYCKGTSKYLEVIYKCS